MATTKKAPSPEVQQNGTEVPAKQGAEAPAELESQTLRPGEILVANPTDRVIFIGDRSLNGSNPLDNYAHTIDPGVPHILKAYVVQDPRRDGAQLLKAGQLEIVHGDHGVIPAVVNVADTTARAIARDGKPARPPRQQTIEHWRSVVVDWSLAESIVDALEAGCPQEETVRDLCAEYDRSFIERRASQQPWIKRSQELIAIHRAKEAGIA